MNYSLDAGELFSLIARDINIALETYFPADLFDKINGSSDKNKLRIIAEPGRYYPCSAYTLCVGITSKRIIKQSDAQQKTDKEKYLPELESTKKSAITASIACSNSLTSFDVTAALDTSKSISYYLNDSYFSSLKFIDHSWNHFILVNEHSSVGKLYKSSIWGSSSYNGDLIVKECLLPELQTDEYMMVKIMGAYTITCAAECDGMPLPGYIYVVSNSKWERIKNGFIGTKFVGSLLKYA